MTTPSDAAEVHAILVDELATVTPGMIDAGSRELTRVSIIQVPDPQRPGKILTMPARISEAERLTAIWTAMLRAKLGGVG